MLQEFDEPNFIMIEKDVLEKAIADSTDALNHLKDAKNFYSLNQIIELGKTDAKKLRKCIFKLHRNDNSIDGSCKDNFLNGSQA